MFNQTQGQDGYKVKSQSIIAIGNPTDEAEYYFDVSQPISVESCFVYVEYQNETQRESIEIHRTSLNGSRLHFYQYNRSNPALRHGTDSFVQINSMASYWNVISKNVDNFGWIRQQANPGLKVKVYGGRINNPILGDFDVSSTTLTLADNSVSYIYFDDIDNKFKASATEPNMYFVLGKITTTSGDITEILDYRASYTGGGIPTSITEAQRDALAVVRNGVQIYNTTAGKLQFYSGGSWYDVPVDGGENQVPRLTEIIEGKARWATKDEALAGTDVGLDWASLVVKPSTIKSELLDRTGFIITSDYPLGEAITDITKSCVFKETAPTFAQATNDQNIGDVAGNTRVSFIAIGTGVASDNLKLSLAKNGSPSAFLRVRMETDNAGSPSGTLVDPNATKDIDPATLTTSLADTTVTFPGSFTVANGTKVHIVVSAVGDVVNASNYYKIGYNTNDTTTRAAKTYDGTNWVSLHTYNNVTDTNTNNVAASVSTDGRFTLTPKKNIYLKTISTVASVTNLNISGGGYNLSVVPSGNLGTFNIVLVSGVPYVISWSGTNTQYYDGTWVSSNTNITISYIYRMYTGFTIISSDYFVGKTTFLYISSTLFHNAVLSLTDSDFAYKTNLCGIATATGVAGSYPKLTVFGNSDNFIGMTEGGTQYLGSTPGGIQSSAGANSFVVGKARGNTKLRVKDLLS